MAATLTPGGSTTFTVTFTPLVTGVRSTTLRIGSDDADENPFDITLNGRFLSFTQDTDGDGLNDASELQLAALGFDWQVGQPALVNTLYTNASGAGLYNQAQYDANRQAGRNDVINSPNTYSLYTLAQVQALHVDAPLLTRDPMTGHFKLTLGLQKSPDLNLPSGFQPFPFIEAGTTINGQGKIEFLFTTPDDAAFFRVEAR
jgi:hypothetical protein